MADPDDITRNPDGSVTVMTFAEAGVAAEPSIGQKDVGLTVAPAENIFNWPHLAEMRWLRAMFTRYPDASRLLFSSWMSRNGTWSNTGVAALEGFLSDITGVPSQVADVWCNPPSIDTGAVQMQVSVPKASPHTFTAMRDTYVFVPVSTITPGQVTEPELTFTEVPNSDPEPATPAGTVMVWMVRTDGVTITDFPIKVPTFPVMKQVGFEIVSAAIAMIQDDLDVGGNTSMDGTLDVDGNVTLGVDDLNVHTFHGSTTTGDDETNIQVVHGDTTTGTDATNRHTFNGIVTILNGVQNTGATAIELVGGATIAANKSIIGDVTTPITGGLVTVLDKVVTTSGIEGAGSAAVDLPEGATIPTGKDLTLVGTSSLVGVSTSTVTSGTFDTIDADGVANVGELHLYSDTTPTISAGAVQSDGRYLFLGDNGLARVLSMPIEKWIAGTISTVNGIDDTGANVSNLFVIGDVLMVELKSEMKNSDLTPAINLRIEANAVAIGSTEPHRATASNVYTTCNRSVEFTVPATAVYTFKARYGAVNGTTSAINVLMTVRRKNV